MNKLERASLYGSDADGNPIRDAGVERCVHCDMPREKCEARVMSSRCCEECWHPQRIKVKETPPHALSRPDAVKELENKQELEHRMSLLTDEERAVWELHQQQGWYDKTLTVTSEQLFEWRFDPHTHSPKQLKASGMWEVKRRFPRNHSTAEIAARTGLSERQVRSRIQSGNRKLNTGR